MVKPVGHGELVRVRAAGGKLAKIADEVAALSLAVIRADAPLRLRRDGKRVAQRLFQLDDPLPATCLHGDYRDSKFFGKLDRIEPQTGFFGHVHHVEGEHGRHPEFDDLQDELEMTLEVRGIHHAYDEIRFRLAGQIAAKSIHGHFLVRRWRAQ